MEGAGVERTLALIKPDAVRAGKAEEIKQLIELHSFTIIAQQKIQLTRTRAEEFYGEHLGKPFFPKLVEFMTSGPIWALVLAKPDAIKSWRALMGPTNVFKAREEAPRSLRALYGTDGTQNATHGSDSPKSAVREIKFFFPNQVLEPLLDAEAAKLYITEKLQPALSRALTALAREKPSAEKFEAITFLANFLLTHNPNKPKIVSPDEWDPSVEEEDDESDFAAAQLEAAQASAAARAALRAASASPAAATQKGAGAAPPPTAAEDAAAGDASSAPALPAEAPARAASIRAASPTAAAAAAPAPPPSAPAAPAPAGGADADITDGFATDDADVLHAAATKVQATFRGHQARKEVAALQAQASPRTQAAAESAPSAGPGIILPPALPPTVLAVPNGVKDRPQVLRAVFAQLDRDGSGAIDREEFKAALGAMGRRHGGQLADELDKLLASMDANSDNLVSADEFLEHMSWVSNVLEGDAEFSAFIKDSYNITVEHAVDGSSGTEFVIAMSGYASRESVLRAVFAQLDHEGSGHVDKHKFDIAIDKLRAVSEVHADEAQSALAMVDDRVSEDQFVTHMGWMSSDFGDDAFFAFLEDAFAVHVRGEGHQHHQDRRASAAPLVDDVLSGAPAAAPPAEAEETPAAAAPAEVKEAAPAPAEAAAPADEPASAPAAEPEPQEAEPEQQQEQQEEVPAPAVEAESEPVAAPAAAEEAAPEDEEYSDEQKAAVVKIQAAGRGMLDRKRVANLKAQQQQQSPQQEGEGGDGAGAQEEAAAEEPQEVAAAEEPQEQAAAEAQEEGQQDEEPAAAQEEVAQEQEEAAAAAPQEGEEVTPAQEEVAQESQQEEQEQGGAEAVAAGGEEGQEQAQEQEAEQGEAGAGGEDAAGGEAEAAPQEAAGGEEAAPAPDAGEEEAPAEAGEEGAPAEGQEGDEAQEGEEGAQEAEAAGEEEAGAPPADEGAAAEGEAEVAATEEAAAEEAAEAEAAAPEEAAPEGEAEAAAAAPEEEGEAAPAAEEGGEPEAAAEDA